MRRIGEERISEKKMNITRNLVENHGLEGKVVKTGNCKVL